MLIKPPTKIIVKDSPIHGLGVFCSEPIQAGEIIESCAFLKFPQSNEEKIPVFQNYSFCWPRSESWVNHAMVLGYGSFYNHSQFPSAQWYTEEDKFVFYALKDINVGEEIFIDYANGSAFD